MEVRVRVFVGSSSEAAAIDRVVRSTLELFGVDVVGWREAFRPGDYAIDVLLELGTSVDGALLVVTPDDLVTHHGDQRLSPRDNVLLELGVFLAHFGKRRAGVVHVRSEEGMAALPSDLRGLTTLELDPGNPGQNELRLSKWLEDVRAEVESQHPALPQVFGALREASRTIPVSWREEVDRYVISSFLTRLKMASQGQIVLSPGQYYQAIFDEIDRAAAPCEVLGVATLSSSFWNDVRDQRRYLAKNNEAVLRGTRIRRMFIVADHEWPKLLPIVRLQLDAGISIRRARPTILAEAISLEDMVMFVDSPTGYTRAYVADHSFDDPGRIRRGRLLLDAGERGDLLEAFDRVWRAAQVVTHRDLAKEEGPVEASAPEPGPEMKVFQLAEPVVSCEDAAEAKGIPLQQELKTLLLSTQKGFVALHLPGDGEASLRSVKRALEISEACLATPEELEEFGLQPGTVCAVKDPIWSLPHLISRRVMDMKMVSTNNGTLRGFYRFHPAVLLEADSVMLGDFEGGKPSERESPEEDSDRA